MWADANATTYILALPVVSRRLQEEEQQLRTSSLPAIPNPFPELCSPASSPVLSPGSLPPGEPPTDNYVSPIVTVVNYWGIHKTTKQFVFYLQGCLCGFNIFATHYNLVWLNLDAKHGPSVGLLLPLKNRMWDISRYWYTSVFMTVRVTPALHPSLWRNKAWIYTYVVACQTYRIWLRNFLPPYICWCFASEARWLLACCISAVNVCTRGDCRLCSRNRTNWVKWGRVGSRYICVRARTYLHIWRYFVSAQPLVFIC